MFQKRLLLLFSCMMLVTGCGDQAGHTTGESDTNITADLNIGTSTVGSEGTEQTPAQPVKPAFQMPASLSCALDDEIPYNQGQPISYKDLILNMEEALWRTGPEGSAFPDEEAMPKLLIVAEDGTEFWNLCDFRLTCDQMLDLMQAYPEQQFLWEVKVGEITVTPDDTEIDLSEQDLSEHTQMLENISLFFPNLEKVILLNCGLDNEGYAAVCDANPTVKFVWEIVMSHWTVRTDQVAFGTFKTCSETFYLQNDEAKYLKYCTDLVALDLGHNYVTDLSFLQYMPELKVLILVDNVDHWEGSKIVRISDLSYLTYCPKLEYLEFFCDSVSDISFLDSLPNLVDLNISYNPIPTEMAVHLYGKENLKRLWMEHTKISYAEFQKLQKSYPGVTMHYYGEGSIDHDWRTGATYNAMRNMLKNNVIDPVFAD